MNVFVRRDNQIVLCSNPDWNAYTENTLDPDTVLENFPEMVFNATSQAPSATKILRHLLWVNKVRVVNDSLYLYNEQHGMFQKLPATQEWLHLSRFFHPRIHQVTGTGTIHEALQRLKSTLHIQLDFNSLNRDPTLVNLENGVLNISELRLLPKSAQYAFTYCLNANYQEGITLADCPAFKHFCNTSLEGNPLKIKLALQILGYLFSRVQGAKKAFFFIGQPNCGKSVIVELIKMIVGQQMTSNIPLHRLGDRFSLGVMSDKAVNLCAEIRASSIRNIDIFKSIVGGDSMTGEFKGKTPFSFSCKTKLLFAGNALPTLGEDETTEAFVSRLCILPFPVSIQPQDRRPGLLEELYLERNGIFSLAMQALKELMDANFQFQACDQTDELFSAFFEQHDHVAEFIRECCCLNPDNKIPTQYLYDHYRKYCEQNGFHPFPLVTFCGMVKKSEGVRYLRFRSCGNPVRGFQGLTLRTLPVI